MGITQACVSMNLLILMMLAVGPDIGRSGGVTLKDEGANQGAVSTINCSGAGVTCTRSGTTGTITIPGGGAGSTPPVDVPLYNDGGAIGCLPASAVDGGCVTAGDQSFNGIKSFPQGVNVDGQGIHLTGPFSFLQQTDGRSLYSRDSVPAASASPSFFMQTLNTRTAGELLRISNVGTAALVLDYAGVLSIFGNGGFQCSSQNSGSYCLRSVSNYLALAGDAPLNYWGHHGQIQAGNPRIMTAGFGFEVYNPMSASGLASDHKFLVSYRGTLSTQDNMTSTTLMICDGTDVNPDPSLPSNRYGTTPPTGCVPLWYTEDGGTSSTRFYEDGGGGQVYAPTATLPDAGTGVCYDWYVATDAGHAQNGEIAMYVSDVGGACQCDSTKYDGGLTSSWRRMSDRSECRPSVTEGLATSLAVTGTPSATTFLRGDNTWATPASGSGNFVEVTKALTRAGVYSAVVTGQTWVSATSKINCMPLGTTADGLTPELVAAAALNLSWSSPVAGTGFTLWIDNPRGLSGTVRFHCTGN